MSFLRILIPFEFCFNVKLQYHSKNTNVHIVNIFSILKRKTDVKYSLHFQPFQMSRYQRYHICSYKSFDIDVQITKTKTKTKNVLKVFGTNSGSDRQRTLYFRKLLPQIRSHKWIIHR